MSTMNPNPEQNDKPDPAISDKTANNYSEVHRAIILSQAIKTLREVYPGRSSSSTTFGICETNNFSVILPTVWNIITDPSEFPSKQIALIAEDMDLYPKSWTRRNVKV